MDRPTVAIYERNAAEWARRRTGPNDDLGLRMRGMAGPGLILDAGCGAGRYFDQLGWPSIGLDATAPMLAIAGARGDLGAPGDPVAQGDPVAGGGVPVDWGRRVPVVQGDLEALPFAAGRFAGVFARHSYLHLPPKRVPQAFAEAARVLVAGGTLLVSMIAGTYAGRALPGDDFPGRWFSLWNPDALAGALLAAGFSRVEVEVTGGTHETSDVVATAMRR